jgi:hypothetical protein
LVSAMFAHSYYYAADDVAARGAAGAAYLAANPLLPGELIEAPSVYHSLAGAIVGEFRIHSSQPEWAAAQQVGWCIAGMRLILMVAK